MKTKFIRVDKKTLDWLNKIKDVEYIRVKGEKVKFTDNMLIEFLLEALKYKKEHLFEPKEYTEEDEYRRAVYARFIKSYKP